jgi:hypothetical protein
VNWGVGERVNWGVGERENWGIGERESFRKYRTDVETRFIASAFIMIRGLGELEKGGMGGFRCHLSWWNNVIFRVNRYLVYGSRLKAPRLIRYPIKATASAVV